MPNIRFSDWIKDNHRRFESLTDAVLSITTRLLTEAEVPYLSISGRTKSVSDCLEKTKRKKYKNPLDQLTDISGIRIVLYFDYDVERVGKIISESFAVDAANSSNRDELLSVNEVGYRSVHFVCGLGPDRGRLKENQPLKDLKFEFQVRTVLQHAWAELAHDRNYKFAGQLPKHLERKLFLLAGLMETADNGFSDLSREIDAYVTSVAANTTTEGRREIEINSLSLEEFVRGWAERSGYRLKESQNKDGYVELVKELADYGIRTLGELEGIIPADFVEKAGDNTTTIFGVVRDWMIINDPDRFLKTVEGNWFLQRSDVERFKCFMDEDALKVIVDAIGVGDDEPTVWEDDDFWKDYGASMN